MWTQSLALLIHRHLASRLFSTCKTTDMISEKEEAPELGILPGPLGIRHDLLAHKKTTFIMKQPESRSVGEFTAKTVNDRVLLKTTDHPDLKWGRFFSNEAGRTLFLLKRAWRGYEVEQPNGTTVLQIHLAWVTRRTRLKIKFKNDASIVGQPVCLKAYGVRELMTVKHEKISIATIKWTHSVLRNSGQEESRFECEVADKMDMSVVRGSAKGSR